MDQPFEDSASSRTCSSRLRVRDRWVLETLSLVLVIYDSFRAGEDRVESPSCIEDIEYVDCLFQPDESEKGTQTLFFGNHHKKFNFNMYIFLDFRRESDRN